MDNAQKIFFKKFGAEVRRLRISKNMTLEDTQEFGFSTQHFQKLESGLKAANFYTAYRIARAFGISLSKLVKIIED